ncbi:MAG: formylmethanofuran dehydrogenase subunit C [Alphaproteobacteria bacterium]
MGLTLSLTTAPEVPVEAEALSPDKLAGLSEKDVAAQPVLYGNRKACIGDFFRVSGRANGQIRIEGDVAKFKMIGSGMKSGRIVIAGSAGAHLGAGMAGGEIVVEGDAGDWTGLEMAGGRIVVQGNAGHMVGSAHRGSRIGMLEGEIIVHGNVGNEFGNAMRNGLIAAGGDSGDFTGVNMLAGTIVVLGKLGQRSGAGMKRGTIVSMHDAELLPTFSYACTYHPAFLRLYLTYLAGRGLPITEPQITGMYQRWSGDAVELNRGEALLFAG